MKLNFNKVSVGQSINFSKDFTTPVTGKISFNLNWGKINNQPVDLDSILVMESRKGINNTIKVKRPLTTLQKILKFLGFKINEVFDQVKSKDTSTKVVYFGNLQSQGVIHHGDDRTGAWAKGEFIEVDLDNLNPNIDTLTFVVLSFSKHDFSSLPFAEIKVSKGTPSNPIEGLVEHNLTNFNKGTRNIVLAQLVRNDQNEWVLTAMSKESTDNGVQGAINLARETK